MTTEEMRNRIEEECYNRKDDNYCINKCSLKYKNNCWALANDEEIKENYKLMFGKEESEMKNEFDFNELKAGMAIKVNGFNELYIGIQINEDIIFFDDKFFFLLLIKKILLKINIMT